jgi:hypothetical protein
MTGSWKDKYGVRDHTLLPAYIQEVIEKRRFSVNNPPPDTSWRLTKQNPDGSVVGVAAPGELVMVYGAMKSRKSTILNCITTSCFIEDVERTLGFQYDLKPGEEILHFDTEMPLTAFHRRQVKMNRMCGYGDDNDIPNLQAFSLKPYNYLERRKQIDWIIEHTENVGLIILDQTADLVKDINDRDSTAELIDLLSVWSDKTQAVILGCCHVTRGTEDMTGTMGHELAKKMDSGFFLEKERETKYTKVTHLLSREEDVDTFKFEHDSYGLPTLVMDDYIEF